MLNGFTQDSRRDRNAALLEHVRLLAVVPLGEIFQSVMDVLPARLDEQAGSGGASQIDLIEAKQEVRRRREHSLSRFRSHLVNAWQLLELGRPLSVEYKLAEADLDRDGAARLSLLSYQDMEVRLAIRRMADAIAARWRTELMRVNRYVGLLAGGIKLSDDTLPFGPHHLGAGVFDAFEELTLAPAARLEIIRICEDELQSRLGVLYAGLEQRLMQVIQASERALLQPRSRRRIPSARLITEGEADGEQAPDWIARFFAQWQPPDAAGTAPAGNEHARAVQEILPADLHALLQRSRQLEQRAGPDARRALSQRELLSVLSLLQSMPEESPAGPRPARLKDRLKDDIRATGAKLGIDPARVRLDPVDEDMLDLVAMLFEVMLDECNLQGPVRQDMQQLLVPYAKVALLSPDLFLRENDPPRRLLNLLADAAESLVGDEAAEKALRAEFDRTVDAIQQDFAEHTEVFAGWLQSFGTAFASYKRRVEIAERRATELHRAQERREEARRFADGAAAARLQGRTLPPAISDFMSRYWSPYVGMTVLRGESGADDLAQALALADALLEELDLARVHDQARPWLEQLQPALTKLLDNLGLSQADAQAARAALRDALSGQASKDAAALSELPPLPRPPLIAQPEAPAPAAWEEPHALAEVDEVTADYFRQLPMGTWLDFVSRSGSVRAGKLSWISPISARLMFVDRSGSRMCVASPDELSAMAQLDRVRMHRHEDAFYSAMQGAIDQLEN
ncbi:DUF1631 family protein [Pseudoxanthomonas winnipegensis]|jgi:hypothetical protein|uniref:DUF1631 family protein n=1 Tax=Pseudoxanthomonas winnipegensis TaxID=2480810 RepID=A0ABY1WHI0_9GAMM|nr:DUF1631 family protein [Pseudoxanthomonas winnipegensis]TAA10643.1 DUF1631 family protein [Pseudoxanthomonas winnipegensis]TAA22200.1 DUF1631 family protein [Pseudoxanthomonas winnipegensis]TAH74552.1 DUF1631 family protein [Pseudoxanthomonas winnipegensis]